MSAMHATDLLVALRLDAVGVAIAHYHVACKQFPVLLCALVNDISISKFLLNSGKLPGQSQLIRFIYNPSALRSQGD